MSQVIKIKRGGISGLSGASTVQGELIIATGSLGNNVDGPFLLAHGDSLGLVAGAVFTGSSVPTITDSQLNGILFYDDANSKFVRLDTNGNQSLNIEATGFSGDTDGVSEGSTNLYYTDARVKTKLNSEGVISGSDQIATSFAQTILDDTDAATVRGTIGVDAAGTDNSTDVTLATVTDNYLTISNQEITAGTVPISLGGTGAATAGAARTALGVDPAGTDNSTDVTLANTNYLSLSGQVLTGGTVPVGSGGTGATTAAGARTALGVDAAGTDNSTNVTLAGSYDYITISGQTITRNQITNDDLAGSIANAKLANSAITIAGQSTSLGGSVTAATILGAGSTSDLSEGTNLYYTDARVKTKLNSEGVISGSGMSPTFTDLTVEGNLSVEGTLTTVNSNEVNIGDRIIVLNSANGSGDAGINVYDADSPFSTGSLLYESTDNYWKAGVLGSEKRIVTFNADNPADNGFIYTNGSDEVVAAAGSTAGDILQWNGSAFEVSNEIDGGTY